MKNGSKIKILSIIIVVFALMLTLAACNSKDESQWKNAKYEIQNPITGVYNDVKDITANLVKYDNGSIYFTLKVLYEKSGNFADGFLTTQKVTPEGDTYTVLAEDAKIQFLVISDNAKTLASTNLTSMKNLLEAGTISAEEYDNYEKAAHSKELDVSLIPSSMITTEEPFYMSDGEIILKDGKAYFTRAVLGIYSYSFEFNDQMVMTQGSTEYEASGKIIRNIFNYNSEGTKIKATRMVDNVTEFVEEYGSNGLLSASTAFNTDGSVKSHTTYDYEGTLLTHEFTEGESSHREIFYSNNQIIRVVNTKKDGTLISETCYYENGAKKSSRTTETNGNVTLVEYNDHQVKTRTVTYDPSGNVIDEVVW